MLEPAKCTSRHIGNQLAICLHLAPLFVLFYLAVDDFLTCVQSHDIHMKKKTETGIFSGLLFHSRSLHIPSSYMCTMQTLQYTVQECRLINYSELIAEWMCVFSPHTLHFLHGILYTKKLWEFVRSKSVATGKDGKHFTTRFLSLYVHSEEEISQSLCLAFFCHTNVVVIQKFI